MAEDINPVGEVALADPRADRANDGHGEKCPSHLVHDFWIAPSDPKNSYSIPGVRDRLQDFDEEDDPNKRL